MPSHEVEDVRADRLAQPCHRVDEGELGGEERVRGVLDELGGRRVGDHRRRARVAEQLGHPDRSLTVVGADDDAVGVERVRDRGALAEELGVGDDDDVGATDDALDEAHRADGHRRLVHDDRTVGEVRGDLRGGRRHARRGPRSRPRTAGSRRRGTRTRSPTTASAARGPPGDARSTAPPSASRRGRARRSASGPARSASKRRSSRSAIVTRWPWWTEDRRGGQPHVARRR